MPSSETPSPGQPDPAALLALGLATQATDACAYSSPPPCPAELAAEFPRLEIIELIGRGGMGAVYKVRQTDLDRHAALKILRADLDADPGFAERFTREARALAQLNHPGIVTLYEFGRTPAGRYFILMEFVDGVNLRQLLAAGRLAPREALAIVPPLCDALQYAHDRGLVHRDIKPENLLIDRLGRVKIADFGIARLASGSDAEGSGRRSGNASKILTSAGEVMGTPHYMAPEQRDRPAEVDHRADLYALGVVLYQMLTDELPAAGQLQPPSHRVQLDVRLDEIVLRALEKDPARRYAAASEFKTQIETLATTPASAPSPSTPPTAAPPRTYHGFSYRSRRTFFGLPLLHVATGLDPATGRRQVARGIVAIGDFAQGFIALGGVAMGGFTFGGISLGVFSYGGLVLALFAVGGLGVGGIAAFAGLAIAPVALGGYALGWYAFGGSAWGTYASSPARHDHEAIAFFGSWAREFTTIGGIATLAAMGFGFAIMFYAIEWARRRVAAAAESSSSATPPSTTGARRHFSLWIVFLILFAAYIDWLVLSAGHLPERVASHFNAQGQADGWMSRVDYLSVAALVPFGLAAFLAVVGWSLRWLPLNIPRRDYWLAPERKAVTAAILFRWMAVPACLLLILFAEIHLSVVLANQMTAPHLSVGFLMGPVFGFLISLMLWIVGLVLRFAEPDATPAKTRVQTWALFAVGLLTVTLCAIPLLSFAALKPDAAPATSDARAWNLDVIVTDQSAWPPKTLSPEHALPVAGAALALLGSSESRQPATNDNWQTAIAAPHLRLEYPRAAEGKMPDAILIPLPLTDTSELWTRKTEAITRHSAHSPAKAEMFLAALNAAGISPRPTAPHAGSPVITRSIKLRREHPVAYDFDDGGRFVDYDLNAASAAHGIVAAQQWHVAHRTDVFADPDSFKTGVLFIGTALVDLPDSAWETPPHILANTPFPSRVGLMTFVAAPDAGQEPPTRLYRTAQGGLFLVQLVGATEARDVLLRYKPIATTPPPPLEIHLSNQGVVTANGVVFDAAGLHARLLLHARASDSPSVVIRAETHVKATSITAVLEACAAAKIVDVAVAAPSAPATTPTPR